MTTATTKKLRKVVESPAKLLNRIRDIKKQHEYADRKVHKLKLELYKTVYLYYVTQEANGHHPSSVTDNLLEKIGATRGYWTNCRKYGEFIRDNKLDTESMRASSLVHATKGVKIEKRHLARVCKALQNGEGPSEMRRLMCELGYTVLPPVPSWTRKMVRQHKKEWEDWKPEMATLLSAIKKTSDGKQKVQLVLKVGGREKVVV